MQRRHTRTYRVLPIANDINLSDDFKFIWIQEHQFAARAEKIYPSPVRPRDGWSDGWKVGSKIKKSTAAP